MTSDMNDVVEDLLVLIGQRFGLMVYEALLAVGHMAAFDEESRSLAIMLTLEFRDRIQYL